MLVTNPWFKLSSLENSIYYLDIQIDSETWSYWIASINRTNMSYSVLLF